MLQIINGIQITTDRYSISHKSNGLDELHFSIPLDDPAYPALREESRIYETTEKQTYAVKRISGGALSAEITCQLDVSIFCAEALITTEGSGDEFAFQLPGFAMYEKTELQVLTRICNGSSGSNGIPYLAGWRVVNRVGTHRKRTIEMDGPNGLEVLLQMQKTFGCVLRFDTDQKTVTVRYPEEQQLSNSYAIDTVNLRRPPEYRGDSSEIYTRLYPIGKDGLTIRDASQNTSHSLYLTNDTYFETEKIISQIWKDDRYESADSLYEAALAKLAADSQPVRSWALDVVDLNRIDPEAWPDLGLGLFTVLRLVDNHKGVTANVQVMEDTVWPYYPDENQIKVSTVSGSVQRTVRGLYRDINDPNSEYQQKLSVRNRLLTELQKNSTDDLKLRFSFIADLDQRIRNLGG